MLPVNGLKEIAHLYEEIDAAISDFKKISGLYCPHLCSRCCNFPSGNIEASILEVLPLVVHLMKINQLETALEKLNAAGVEESVCILYTENIQPGSQGRCTVYEYRPLVCRLFGHSVLINKYGDREIIFCSVLKKKNEGAIEKINSEIRGQGSVPVLSEYAMRSSMINPAISKERFPLNTAIKKAIDFMGLRNSYGEVPQENH